MEGKKTYSNASQPVNPMPVAGDKNCFEFYLEATSQYGEYDAFQHLGYRGKRSEFLEDVNSLAYYFQNVLKIGRGDCFTIFTPTNVESITAFYALNKIGAIVNFVHPLLPTEALKESMEESDSKGVMIMDLLAKNHVKTLNESGVPVIICRNSDYASKIKKPVTRLGEGTVTALYPKLKNRTEYETIVNRYRGKSVEGIKNNGLDTAVYLNGGGTTGKSKTIKLSSKAINENVHCLGYIDHIIDPGEEGEIIILPFFHAFGLVVAMHMTMCNAARIIPMMQFNAKRVVRLYKENRISGIIGIPNMFKKLYHTKGFDGPQLSNTRMMFVGGDDCSTAFINKFNDMLEKNGTTARLRQGYGLTEVGSVCCANTNWVYKEGSVGKPLEGVEMQIWDDEGNELPDGQVGEICISGPTIMQGYLVKGGKPDEGLYYKDGKAWVRSGDLGYKDDDGFFYFSGRKKRIIIISGYNVYPVDIENLMDTLPFIRESCAVEGYSSEGKPLVKLYVRLFSPASDKQKEDYKKIITKTCEQNLSKFSVPHEIIFRQDLPHTPLEKIDFMKLSEEQKTG